MKRTQARELCMQLVYEMIIKEEYNFTGLDLYVEENPEDLNQQSYMTEVLNHVIEHKSSMDDLIKSYSVDWEFDRIARVDLAILKVGFSELLYMPDVPNHVTINEAVELAKKFGTEHSPSYINGVLGKYHREYQEQDETDNEK
ncbi:MAG: transcription antitermination factor NusB [Tindallia sp. MSAO_Bac2]|nr:MAG: transcription antitermination factor NusB [Tindallia sp. MSAO_Bac2]